MDERHRQLAQVGLAAAGQYGFALAGGYALAAVTAAYEAARMPVTVVRRAELFARLHVGSDVPVQVELAYDWRAHGPAMFGLGPLFARDDAVAGKVLALWGRQETRDYIDVYAASVSGDYTGRALVGLAVEAQPGFDVPSFAAALRGVETAPDADFQVYGIDPATIQELRRRLRNWGGELAAHRCAVTSEETRGDDAG